jgi:hypothetical protein
MSGLILSRDGEAGFEVSPVKTARTVTVHNEDVFGRVEAKRMNDGRVYVSIFGKSRSAAYWRKFGSKIITAYIEVPAKPISFVKALEAVPEWEVPSRGWLSISIWGGEDKVGPETDGAVKVEQAERATRARVRVERETKAFNDATNRLSLCHELLEPMLTSIEEALA